MTTSVPQSRSTTHKLAGSAAVLSLALRATTGGTFAAFSDSKGLANTAGLDTATLSLSLTEVGTSVTSGVSGLAPGDSVRRLVKLVNTGTGSFTPKLAVTAGLSNALTAATGGLDLLVEQCSVAWTDAATCSGTTTTAYSGDLVTAAPTALTGVTINGDATVHLRTTILMPANATDALSGLSTGALTFTYSGAFLGGQQR